MVFNIEGILAPVFTPFLETGGVDFNTIPIYMAHLNKQLVDGILIGGSTGEGMSLSVDERKSVLEAWITAAKPFGTKIIAQIGGAPMPHVIELAKHAENVHPDAIMVLPELYYKPKNVEKLVHYLQRVSDAAPTLPLIYYHFPMMSGIDVDMRELFSIASSKIPNFKGAKADFGTADQVASLLRPDQRIFIANHILVALNFYARGSYQGSVGQNDDAPMAQQTVSRCIREVSLAMNTPEIIRKYIRFPQNATERNVIKRKFYEKYHLPGVIGCIDCTHIAIVRPSEHEERFFNRKHFHSINTQVQIAPSVLMGHDSSIATVNNMFTDLVHNIVKAVKDGDVGKARDLQKRLNDLVYAIAMQGDFFSSMKAAMELVTGIRMGLMREPNISLTSEQRELLKNNLKSLDIQLQCS